MTPLKTLLARWFKTVIIAGFVAMLATLLIVPRLAQRWDVSIDVTLPVPVRPLTTNYEYDGYYALQATDLFSNTLAGWLRSPDFTARVYDKAGIVLKTDSLRKLEKIFTITKISGQYLTVRFSVADEKEAAKLADAIEKNIKERVSLLNDNEKRPVSFSVFVGKPLVVPYVRDKFFDALVAGLVVVVCGFNAVIIIDAFKKD